MRLTPEQITVIKQAAVKFFGPDTSVRLFGSRADDTQRGGDIDLYIQTRTENVLDIVRSEIAFLAEIKMKLGDQKIDVLIDYPSRKTHNPIYEIARETGITL